MFFAFIQRESQLKYFNIKQILSNNKTHLALFIKIFRKPTCSSFDASVKTNIDDTTARLKRKDRVCVQNKDKKLEILSLQGHGSK